jgi:hypothetical protein
MEEGRLRLDRNVLFHILRSLNIRVLYLLLMTGSLPCFHLLQDKILNYFFKLMLLSILNGDREVHPTKLASISCSDVYVTVEGILTLVIEEQP